MGHFRASVRPLVAKAALVATAAALLSACGSSSPSSSGPPKGTPLQVVLASVERTSANTATMRLDVSVNGTPVFGGQSKPISVSIVGSGAFDFASHDGYLNMTLPGASGESHQVTFRIVGSYLYLSAPQLSALAGGKQWVKVNLSDYEKSQGQNGGPLGGFSSGDPSQILGIVKQIGTVGVVGQQQIDGVTTTEYTGSLDLTKVSPETGSTLLDPKMAQGLGLNNIPIQAWIDDQGRARQIKSTFSVLGLDISITLDFSDFGAPVTVAAPPAGEVADGSSLLQGGKIGNFLGGTSVGA